MQRFTKATRPPSQKDATFDASGVAYVAADAMALLLRDARCLAKNWHPNVVRVRHVDLVGSELTVATELVDGVTLADLIDLARAKRTSDKEPILPYPLIARVIVDVLGGLHGLHGLRDGMNAPLNVFHGELSPANIVLGKDGVARVAHVFRPRPVKIDARSEGRGYASPETLAGEAQQDARADLYSVGAILWEGLAGRRLYPDDDPARVAQRQREEDLARPDVPASSPFARLADVALRALSFDPALRFRTASEMATEIRRITGTRLAPGSAVAQTVMELAGDRIRARRMELDPSSSGARRALAARTAKKAEADTVPKAPPRGVEVSSTAATDPPRRPRPAPPLPKPPVVVAAPVVSDAELDDLPGPRASSPSLPDVPAPVLAAPNGDALALAAAMEVSVGEKSLVEPSSPPPPVAAVVEPPPSERVTVASMDLIAVDSTPRIEVPLARESSPAEPVAVLSVGPDASENAPRRKRFVPIVVGISALAVLLLVVAGIASMGGSKEDTKSTAATPTATSTVTATATATTSAAAPEPTPAEPTEPVAAASGSTATAPTTTAAAAESAPAPRATFAPGPGSGPAPAPKKPKKSSYEPLGI